MGHWLYIAERMKKNLKIPVVDGVPAVPARSSPRRPSPQGKLDFWEMCRPMIADPFLPGKILEGREEEIIPCMACNICLARLFRDAEAELLRPAVARPRERARVRLLRLRQGRGAEEGLDRRRRASPGMQAGAIAAEKGHDVTITEKADHVGGQLAAAAHGPWGDDEFMRLIDYLETARKQRRATFEPARRSPARRC